MQTQYLHDIVDYNTPRRINPLGITITEISNCDYLIHSRNPIYSEELFFLNSDRDANEMYRVKHIEEDIIQVHNYAGIERSFSLQELQRDGYWWSLKVPQMVKDLCGMI